MNALPVFWVSAAFVWTIATAEDGCLLAATECQCSMTTTLGTCMRSQGDETCLQGPCAEGYRCDCFGYERCSIKTCGKYVALGSTSETEPFSCKMNPDGGTCVQPVEFVDTVIAGQNAAAEVATSNDETTFAETSTIRLLGELVVEKKAINDVLKEIENAALRISQSEINAIEEDAGVVMQSMRKSYRIMTEVADISEKVARLMIDVRRYKRETEHLGRLEKETEGQLNAEKGKKDNEKNRVEQLKGDLISLQDARRKTAVRAGRGAKEARLLKKEVNAKLKQAFQERDHVGKVASSVIERANKAIEKTKNKKNESPRNVTPEQVKHED